MAPAYSWAHVDAILKMQQLPTGSYAAKTDIENAFKLTPVKRALYPKLGIHSDNFTTMIKHYHRIVLACAEFSKPFQQHSSG